MPPPVTGITVSIAVFVAPPYDAVNVTGVEVDTVLVLTVNVALAAPAGTFTVAGTVAAALLLASETDAPPVGASMLSVTVPVEDVPPFTLVGLIVIK